MVNWILGRYGLLLHSTDSEPSSLGCHRQSTTHHIFWMYTVTGTIPSNCQIRARLKIIEPLFILLKAHTDRTAQVDTHSQSQSKHSAIMWHLQVFAGGPAAKKPSLLKESLLGGLKIIGRIGPQINSNMCCHFLRDRIKERSDSLWVSEHTGNILPQCNKWLQDIYSTSPHHIARNSPCKTGQDIWNVDSKMGGKKAPSMRSEVKWWKGLYSASFCNVHARQMRFPFHLFLWPACIKLMFRDIFYFANIQAKLKQKCLWTTQLKKG